MNADKVGGYVSKISFNDGTVLDLNDDSIVVFVGPNNAGKSQAIKDVYNLAGDENSGNGIVVKDIGVQKFSGSILPIVKKVGVLEHNGNSSTIRYMNSGFTISGCNIENFEDQLNFTYSGVYRHGWFRDMFVSKLDTSARLSICMPADSIARNQPKTNPIHYVAFNSEYRKILSAKFKEAFGNDIVPHMQFGNIIPLCIGDLVDYGGGVNFADEQERQEAFAEVLSRYPQIQDQGDGMKSFVGILLYLIMDNYCTYLIDEPESFLHPPQALIMGRAIGGTLSSGQQVFISTHSEEVIKGLLDVSPKRVRLVRVTRDNEKNSFAVLENDGILKLWNDPLLKHSNIMSGIFYKTVVLCESDSDCRMYSIINQALKSQSGISSEVHFIHCGGKQRIPKIVQALKALNVDIKVVVDLDVLNSEETFKSITESCGIEWGLIKNDYRRVVEDITKLNGVPIKKRDAKVLLEVNIDWSDEPLSGAEYNRIFGILRKPSPWDRVKKDGASAIPQGDATLAFGRLDKEMKQKGLYIVPVGELEGFVRGVGGHGPTWVNNVIEQYDLDSPVFDEIKKFILEMEL